MIVIPDYLIIDEIRRREEQSRHPTTLEIPIPSYDDIPERMPEPAHDNPAKHDKSPKTHRNNGAIIIDMNSYRRIG